MGYPSKNTSTTTQAGSASFSNITGNPTDNAALQQALSELSEPIPDHEIGKDYSSGEEFTFSTTNTTAVDINNDAIPANKVLIGAYRVAKTASALTNAEMALIELRGGASSNLVTANIGSLDTPSVTQALSTQEAVDDLLQKSVNRSLVVADRDAVAGDDYSLLVNATSSDYTLTLQSGLAASSFQSFQETSGTITIAAGAGVTVNGPVLATAYSFDRLLVEKVSADVYNVSYFSPFLLTQVGSGGGDTGGSTGNPDWNTVVLQLKGNVTVTAPDGGQVFEDTSNYASTVIVETTTTTPYPRITTTDSKFGGASMQFASEDSQTPRVYITAPSGTTISSTGTNEWSARGWFKFDILSSNRFIFGDFGNQRDRVYAASGNLVWSRFGGDQIIFDTAATLATGVWYHIAFCLKAGEIHCYIDGVDMPVQSAGSRAWAPNNASFSYMMLGCYIQSTPQMPFSGYIDDFEINNSVAYYDGAFIPPTTELASST